MQRITAVRHLLEEHRAAAVLVSSVAHVRWISGFTGSAALALVDEERALLITDGRYPEQAAREVENLDIQIASGGLLAHVVSNAWAAATSRLLVQGEYLSACDLGRLREGLNGATVVVTESLLDPLVAAKEKHEIENIRRALEISERVFYELTHWIQPGCTEREVAAEVVCRHMRHGAEKMSFDPIVASGPNSALPHARPGERVLCHGDVVLLDFGCVLAGYVSDMTRTVAVGEWADDAFDIYRVVRDAQALAIGSARSGIAASDLDDVARSHIAGAGYGDFFTHSLGHGVGMQVHEWPRVAARSDSELPEGAVISIEPGVYLPGRFGVRIEDLVVLRSDGCDNLSRSSKEPIVL